MLFDDNLIFPTRLIPGILVLMSDNAFIVVSQKYVDPLFLISHHNEYYAFRFAVYIATAVT